MAWNLSSQTDARQNTINYSFLGDATNGSSVIDSISYSDYTIKFNRITLNEDQQSLSYVSAVAFRALYAFESIEIKKANNALRKYKISYLPTDTNVTRKLRLDTISLCALQNAVEICQKPTKFNWQNTSYTNLNNAAPNSQVPGEETKIKFGDINGDGRLDMVFLKRDATLWWKKGEIVNGATEFSAPIRADTGWCGINEGNSPGRRCVYQEGITTDPLLPVTPASQNENEWSATADVDPSTGWYLYDFNNDGRDDLIHSTTIFTGEQTKNFAWWLRQATGNEAMPFSPRPVLTQIRFLSGWVAAATYDSSQLPATAVFEDHSGDGIPDFQPIGTYNNTIPASPRVLFSSSPTTTGIIYSGLNYKYFTGSSATSDCTYNIISRRFPNSIYRQYTQAVGNGNGDAQSDILAHSKAGCGPGTVPASTGLPRWAVLMAANNNSAGNFEGFKALMNWRIDADAPVIGDGLYDFRLNDINGDGLTDAVYKLKNSAAWNAQLNLGAFNSSGLHFQAPICLRSGSSGACTDLTNPEQILFADYDGDGVDDLFEPNNGTYRVYLGRSGGYISSGILTSLSSANDRDRFFVDLDADAKLDLVSYSSNSGRYSSSRSSQHHTASGVVSSIDEGLGTKIEIQYAPSSFSDLYVRDFTKTRHIGPLGTSSTMPAFPECVQSDFEEATVCRSAKDIPPFIVRVNPAENQTGVLSTANVVIRFSEAITTQAGWFSMTCSVSGAVAVTESGSGNSRTLDPINNLRERESCTVTLDGTKIFDVDLPVQALSSSGGYSYSFATHSLVFDVSNPQWLVKRVKSSMPTALDPNAMRSTRYRYVGQKLQSGGRGSLGFRAIETLDEQKLIQSRTEFHQDFPYVGMPSKTQTVLLSAAWPEACLNPDAVSCIRRCSNIDDVAGQCKDFDILPSDAKVLSESTTSYAQRVSQSTPGLTLTGSQVPIFVYPTNSVSKTFDLNSDCAVAVVGNACNERLLSTQSSLMSNFDPFGNAQNVSASVVQHDGSAGSGTTLQSTTETTVYENRVGTPWQLGLPVKKTIAIQRPGSSRTRVQTMAYTSEGLIAETHIQPQFQGDGVSLQGDTNLTQTSHSYFEYDDYGNQLAVRICSNHSALIANNGAECKATNASTNPAATKSVPSPELWVRRFNFQAMDSSNTFVATRYAAFDGSAGLGGVASNSTGFTEWGVPTSSFDANGVETKIFVGRFGMPYATATSQGSLVTTRMRLCTGHYCPSDARYFANTIDQSGPDTWTYFDALGRTVLSLSESLGDNNGARYVAVKKTYDALGREFSTSQPYFAFGPNTSSVGNPVAAASVFETKRYYDVLDRVTQTHNPDGGVVTSSFLRYVTTTTLPVNSSGQSQDRIETRNALNEMVGVEDAAGLVVNYGYRAGGELRTVSRPAVGSTPLVTSMVYDTLGRKTSMADPDKGTYQYDYNAIGELLQERATSSNATCASYTYDRLGRKRTRTDYLGLSCTGLPEHSASWIYDSASSGLGQLGSESAFTRGVQTISRNFSFDSYARPSQTISVVAGVSYQSRSVFDQYSRPFQSFFRATTDVFAETGEYFEYDAATGIGVGTRDANGGTAGTLYSRVKLTDAFGNPVSEERGLGATPMQVVRQFNPATGLTEWIRAGTAANPALVQNLDYRWDKLGNLEWRHDQSAGRQLFERFSYDAQQRLLTQMRGTQSTNATTPVLSMQYNDLGNITTRNSVSYTYGGNSFSCANNAGPHAASAVGGVSYCFDSRGNQLTSSDGRELSYFAFDLPETIKSSNAGVTATVGFEYGPNHERVVRKNYPNVYGVTGSAAESTHYLGGAEVHRRGTGVEVKRYVGGVVIVQTASGIAKNYQWFDHQGSVVAVTNDAGVPVGSDGQMAYDAFGLRRDTSGSEFSLVRLLSFNSQATTRHGYTGHEMVDEVGLIHMNGRMYDPRIARFIQGDPIVQDPYNSQSLNRYSYVMNNPLNATDPTGLFSVGRWSFFSSIFAASACPSCHSSPSESNKNPAVHYTLPQGSIFPAFSNGLSARQNLLGFTMPSVLELEQRGRWGGWGDAMIGAGKEFADFGINGVNFMTQFSPGIQAFDRLGFVTTLPTWTKSDTELPGAAFVSFGTSVVSTFLGPEMLGGRRFADDFVTLYHGTSSQAAASIRSTGIDLSKSRAGTDFGLGFYTTTDKAQALKWVQDRHPGGEVLEFSVPRSAFEKLNNFDTFNLTDSSLSRFFRHNRLEGRLHSYDTVSGPMLGNPKKFLGGAEARKFGQQTSFHSSEALDLLYMGLKNK